MRIHRRAAGGISARRLIEHSKNSSLHIRRHLGKSASFRPRNKCVLLPSSGANRKAKPDAANIVKP